MNEIVEKEINVEDMIYEIRGKQVMLDSDLDNPASWKTMEALGGKRIAKYYDSEFYNCDVVKYSIDVKKSLETYKDTYECFTSSQSV